MRVLFSQRMETGIPNTEYWSPRALTVVILVVWLYYGVGLLHWFFGDHLKACNTMLCKLGLLGKVWC